MGEAHISTTMCLLQNKWLREFTECNTKFSIHIKGEGIDYCFFSQMGNLKFQFSSVTQSCPTLRPHELQHTRSPCPSPTPGVHSNSRPSNQWCHPAISSSVVPFSCCPQSLPASVFSNESILCMRWPKYWSFSFSIIPSKEHPELISFRMDWLDRKFKLHSKAVQP